MSSITTTIVSKFVSSLDTDKDYGLSEILAILSANYKEVKEINSPKTNRKVARKLDFGEGNAEISDDTEKKPRKKNVKRERDADGNIIKKRAPSAYNIFVAEKITEFKNEFPELNSKEVFKKAIEAWNTQKTEKLNVPTSDEDINDGNDE